MTETIGDYIEFIYCGCGCGFTRPLRDKQGHKGGRFISGHQNVGRLHTEEWKKNHSKILTGRKHSEDTIRKQRESMKGKNMKEKVGYIGLHVWIRRNLSKPEFCHLCNTNIPREVACITGIYSRELKNWAWFCVKCHHIWDNHVERVKITRKLNKKIMVG